MAAKKFSQPQLHEAVESLRKEFRAAHRLKHENIVKLLGVCVDDPDWVCLLMELVPRGSLRKLLEAAPEKVTGSESMQLKLAHGIAAGMAYLHGRTPPMLHHDLKSENVLIGENIDGFVPKIADFGLATGTGGSTARTTRAHGAGTLAYKAPELFRREAVHDGVRRVRLRHRRVGADDGKDVEGRTRTRRALPTDRQGRSGRRSTARSRVVRRRPRAALLGAGAQRAASIREDRAGLGREDPYEEGR